MCINDAGLGLASMQGGERVHESNGMLAYWQSIEHDTYRRGSVVQEKHRARRARRAYSEAFHLLDWRCRQCRRFLQGDAHATVW
jgi:hypothetical protein